MTTTFNATSVVETITPAIAQRILNENNHTNRNLSSSVVNSYAETMKRGDWILNGEAICFDSEGNLQNGQHRLAAIVKSGRSIDMFVCRGVSSKSFSTYDCGRARTAGQIIGMSGAKNYNQIASAIKVVESLRTNTMSREASGSFGHSTLASCTKKMTNTQQLDEYERDRDGYQNAVRFSELIRNNFPKTSYGWGYIAGVYYYLTHDKNYDNEFVQFFFNNIFSFSTSSYKMLDLLRIKLQKDMGANIKLTAEYKQNLLAKYWNLYVKGEDRKQICWDSEREGRIYFE